MIKVSKIVSLGPNCHTAGILKRLNYKTESYPFDWIISDTDIVIDCINTNFEKYLNKEYYFDNSKAYKQPIVGHTLYKDNMFVHRNPLNNNDDYSYILRCVERFKKLYENKDIVFVYTVYDDYDINKFIKLKEVLDTKINSCYLLILHYVKTTEDKKNKFKLGNPFSNIYSISINISYNKNKQYDIDQSIKNFYKNHNPVSEIFLYKKC